MTSTSRLAGRFSPLVAGMMVFCAVLACSSIDDVIGQRQGPPTPTAPPFATTTPGGRISVSLIDPTADGGTPAITATAFGQIVAPAATATAIAATLQAATAIAAGRPALPNYQSGECPDAGGPVPPAKPIGFAVYPEVVGRYLSSGGPTTILEALLRSWGALGEWGIVQADTDLTGDGLPEILVNLVDPATYQPGRLSPGQLLIYGCQQRGYRLLYSTGYAPDTMLPEMRRVGDINGDVLPEVVYSQKRCSAAQIFSGRCEQVVNILRWNAGLGVFTPLTTLPIGATNARIAIADPDADGNWEILLQFSLSSDPAAGAPRRATQIWDWDGTNYGLAQTQLEAPVYRIHAIHDADYLFEQADWRNAIRLYDRARDDGALLPWTAANETAVLRAYAQYRKILANISLGRRSQANEALNSLLAENPPGTPGEVYAALGQSFLDSYNRRRDRGRACAAALEVAATRADALITLNSYGSSNRAYSLTDLCPFTER